MLRLRQLPSIAITSTQVLYGEVQAKAANMLRPSTAARPSEAPLLCGLVSDSGADLTCRANARSASSNPVQLARLVLDTISVRTSRGPTALGVAGKQGRAKKQSFDGSEPQHLGQRSARL